MTGVNPGPGGELIQVMAPPWGAAHAGCMNVRDNASELSRPTAIRIDEALCNQCELCLIVAPVIAADRARIPVTPDTLEAMALCPTGALLWREAPTQGETSEPDGPPGGRAGS